MTSLTVRQIKSISQESSIDEVTFLLRKETANVLAYAPWPGFSYKPHVTFSLVCGADCFCLQFRVNEKDIKAQYTKTNEQVYKDSCVEFFISLDDGSTYYNFEFNCIGTVLCGFGHNRHNRERVSQHLLDKIKRQSTIQRQKDNENWELTVIIPFFILERYNIASLNEVEARANFYKCGDELLEPHYLCWSNIESDRPDFHLPEFFGELLFE